MDQTCDVSVRRGATFDTASSRSNGEGQTRKAALQDGAMSAKGASATSAVPEESGREQQLKEIAAAVIIEELAN